MGLINRLGELIACLFERHKFVRRATVFWMYALVTHAHFVIYRLIAEQKQLDAHAMTAFGLTVGMVATLTAWYLQVRYHEDKPKS